MALKVELKPNERIIIGACVVTNTDQRARLLIDGDRIPILREKDILTPETADTPAKLVYLAVQLMYLSPDPMAHHPTYFSLVRDILTRDAERVAVHRGHQQSHPERRSLSRAEGSEEADQPRGRSCSECAQAAAQQTEGEPNASRHSRIVTAPEQAKASARRPFIRRERSQPRCQIGRYLTSVVWYSIDVV